MKSSVNYLENTVGQRIKEVRQRAGLTQALFGEKIGITGASVMNYEKGTKLPPLETVMNVARCFDVSLDWLCGIEKAKKPFTYADAVREIIDIADMLDMRADIGIDPENTGKHLLHLVARDEAIASMLGGWIKMRQLKQDGIVDEPMYKTWVDGVIISLEKYSFDSEGWEMYFNDN